MLPAISPAEAARLLKDGATLVDVREPDERARVWIPGSAHLPLSQLDQARLAAREGAPVLFHCRSGMRTKSNEAALGAKAGACQAFIVEGGIDAWRAAGLPVAENRKAPLEIMRQVQIGAGSLVLLGVLGGTFVAPWLYALAGFVGAGLVFAGATGFCGMALLLRHMPWNRTPAPPLAEAAPRA